MINPTIKSNRKLLAAGWIELIYGAGECGDTLFLFILQAHLVSIRYPTMNFSEINNLLINHPLYLAPVFAFFALGRLMAAIGLLRNRLWGFWLSIFISSASVVWAVFFLPLGGLDMLLCLAIVLLLLVGRFNQQSILSK